MSDTSHSPETVALQAEVSAPHPSERDASLSQGKLLLSVLSQKAAVARAEAQIAELRLLLSEAESGNSRRLKEWLHRHSAEALQGQSPADFPSDLLPERSIHSDPNNDPPASWETWLPGARSRLQQRAELLQSNQPVEDASLWLTSHGSRLRFDARHQPLSSQVDALVAPADRLPTSADRQGASTDKHRAPAECRGTPADSQRAPANRQDAPADRPRVPANQAASSSTHAGTQPATSESRRPVPASAARDPAKPARDVKRQQQLKALARRFDSEQLSEKVEQQHRQRTVSRVSGLIASTVVHILLIVFLAFFTLRLPAPPASLAFEAVSSDITTEPIEISQPLEVTTPESAEASEALESFDVSESLAEATSAMSSALGDMVSVVPPTLPSAAMSAATAAGSPGPMSTSSSFFGAAASGNCFCYIIDGSGSMRNGPWEAAKLELLKSLASLREKQRFYIIFFNQELSAIPLPGEREPAPRPLYATQENLDHARRWVDTLRIDIGASPKNALQLAIEKETDAIYLLTDGVTTVDIPGFLRKENRIDDLILGEQVRVPIHTIAFYSLAGQEMLKQIAMENKGQFIYVPDPRKRK